MPIVLNRGDANGQHCTADLGVTFFDTAAMYGPHNNVALLGKLYEENFAVATCHPNRFESLYTVLLLHSSGNITQRKITFTTLLASFHCLP